MDALVEIHPDVNAFSNLVAFAFQGQTCRIGSEFQKNNPLGISGEIIYPASAMERRTQLVLCASQSSGTVAPLWPKALFI